MPWGRRGFGKIQCVCIQCHQVFFCYRAHIEYNHNRGKFCSRSCKEKWQSEHVRGDKHPHWKGGLVERHCVICGTAFLIKPKVLKQKGGGQFCSKKCVAQARHQLFLWNNPTLRADVREKLKQKWQDPEYKKNSISAILQGLLKRPTSLEQQFISLCEREKLPYEYTGNGSFLIGWKNPDFVNVNGAKICVEVALPYFHPDPWAKKRIEHFAKYGWKCYIFFSKHNKLDEQEILNTLSGVVR